MSVIIKGMEMPRRCVDCRMSMFNNPPWVQCQITGYKQTLTSLQGKDTRPEWCPLGGEEDRGMSKQREIHVDMGYPDAVVFDDPQFDDAIVGITTDGRVAYDYDKMVKSLMEQDDISEIDAIEFIDYNTLRALPYFQNSPIVIYPITEE